MKRFAPLLLLLLTGAAHAADINPNVSRPDAPGIFIKTNLRDRGDSSTTYAPTYNCESIFSYAQGNSTTTVSSSPGLFHTLTISSGVANGGGLLIYDSTTASDVTRPIAKFENGTGTEDTYLFDVKVTSGILILSPASSSEWTVSYR